MPQYDVFISYARRDYMDDNNHIIPGNIISRIQNALRDVGISYWIDEEGLAGGENFPTRIAEHIKACKVFLFVSTEQSNQSEWVINEVATAYHYHKTIIPFRYDNSEYHTGLMIYLASVQYISYSIDPNNAIANAVNAIQKALNTTNIPSHKASPLNNPKKHCKWLYYALIAVASICFATSAFLLIRSHFANETKAIEQRMVYITPHGECFHTDSTCHTIKRRDYQSITYEQAIQLSRRPCSLCTMD